MSASAGCQLLGKWRIIEADTWDCDYLDLVQPAYIVFGKNGRGEFAFGAVEATLELECAPRIVFFNWTGLRSAPACSVRQRWIHMIISEAPPPWRRK